MRRLAFRGRSSALAVLVALFGFASTTTLASPGPAAAAAAHAIAAKSCSAGYVHAVIGGEQKCLRRGEYCAHRYNSQYHHYGFSCTRRDDRGDYHLT